jgi:hypothetical protein
VTVDPGERELFAQFLRVVHTQRGESPWVVIVEPDAEARLLVVVTVYEVSQ